MVRTFAAVKPPAMLHEHRDQVFTVSDVYHTHHRVSVKNLIVTSRTPDTCYPVKTTPDTPRNKA